MQNNELLHPLFSFMGRPCDESVTKDLAYELIKEGTEEEKAIGDFLLDWLSGSDYVELTTSGSTGKPKKIRVAKQKMAASARATGQFFELQPGQKILLCLPVAYIAGKMMLVRGMVLGLDVCYTEPTSEPLTGFDRTFDFVAMVPKQLQKSLRELHKAKTVIVGGAPVPQELAAALNGEKTHVYETFGMTETLTHIAVRKLDTGGDPREAGPFKALPGVELGKDDRGCLLIKAPFLLTDELQTNDVVELLDDNSFYWVGRYDHIVNSGGVKLFPETIESKIRQVLDQPFFVAGMPHQELGEQLVLVVESRQPEQEIQELLDSVTDFSRYEKPRKVFTLARFQRTQSGKIRRKAILDELLN
ncbi:AMP-binding protein [Zeaxanthinibacter enoshimensis]|uniref:O-succinylbenzoic acid--CoA ligase n=1 Tax=Zeaxanthinibacter enoshimensis TaxID=392009 RepID=A0A4R6TLH5_9FLAO|nr:AMP-binding protein [Zeaxanthinibacter enoshimensis]TDQ31557.1 O-succinylbenzoic acid--CoA ligase [Zeaxanthinibacter enoshimensis]